MKQSERTQMIQYIIDFYFNDLGWVDLEESECNALNMLSSKSNSELTLIYNQHLNN